MTSGSKTENLQQFTQVSPVVPCFSDASGLTGRRSSKTWSGGDAEIVKVKQPRPQPFAYYVWKVDKKGRDYRTTAYHRGSSIAPKRSKSKGEHPYTMSLSETIDVSFTFVDDFASDTCKVRGATSSFFSAGMSSPPSLLDNNFELKMIDSLREKMRGSDFDMSVFLGTSHQSLRLIGDSATRIAGALRYTRKGNLREAARLLAGNAAKHHSSPRKGMAADALSDNWLALQYGWLPLLKDVKNAAEFVAHQLSSPAVHRYKVRRSAKQIPEPGNSGQLKYITAWDVERIQILAIMSEKESLAGLSGVLDPENLAWELLPWSFVADWFIPIGTYLQARSFASSLKGTFVTTKSRIREAHGLQGRESWHHVIGGGAYMERIITMNRTVSTSLNVPSPNFKSLAKVASWQHAVNAVSLLIQTYKR